MKKLVFLFALVFAVSMAMGQSNVDVNQDGGGVAWPATQVNYAAVNQSGTNVSVDIDQVAGTWNSASIVQTGENQSITIDMNATSKWNEAERYYQHGSNSDIDVQQTAESNYSQVWQDGGTGFSGDGNDVDVVQVGTSQGLGVHYPGNYLMAKQRGHDHVVNLEQDAGTYNRADIVQGDYDNFTENNKLVGANAGSGVYWATIDEASPAMQTSDNGYNRLYLRQSGSNGIVGLVQSGDDFNDAEIYQTGDDNSLMIYQTNSNGSNTTFAEQFGGLNTARVTQNTVSGSGNINVLQQ